MATEIDASSVIRLFENNLFDFDPDRQLMLYRENGLNMEFSVPWLDKDVTKRYDLGKVRSLMGEMMRNVKHTEAIKKKKDDPEFTEKLSKELAEFGMQYVEGTDQFAYEENGKYLFVVDVDYIISLLVINEHETVTSLLTAMRDDARGTNNGTQEDQ